MPLARVIAALALVVALGSCASLSEEECLAGDWRQIGVNDGAEGRGTDHIEAHRRACAPVGVSPDAEAWLAGREAGLRLYCRPAKAYEVARRGGEIRAGCTSAELTRMMPAYDWGENYWRLELQIDDVESDISAIDSDIVALPPDAGARRSMLLSRRALLSSRLSLYRTQQRRYATWP